MPGFRGTTAASLAVIFSGCALFGGKHAEETPQARLAEDARITRELEARLAAEPSIGAGRVRLVVTGGEVQLHGSVAGMGAHRCAETNAELTPGVVLVIDYLVLDPGPRTVRCLSPRTAQAR
jgi:hypothetical protein